MMINGNAPFLGSNQMIADCMMDSSISYLNHLPVYSLESSLPVIWHLWKTVWFHVENMIVYMIRVWLVEMASVRCPILIYFDQKKKHNKKPLDQLKAKLCHDYRYSKYIGKGPFSERISDHPSLISFHHKNVIYPSNFIHEIKEKKKDFFMASML